MFVPVQIGVGAGGRTRAAYDRRIELTVRQMSAFGRHAENMSEPLARIGEDLQRSVAAQFATEGATGATGKWTELSPTYATWKHAHSAAPMLVGLRPLHSGTRSAPHRPQEYTVSGVMREELLTPLAMHVSPRRLLYAPTSNIAGFHETGTERMPARPPVDLTLPFLHSIDRVFVGWVAKLMREDGL